MLLGANFSAFLGKVAADLANNAGGLGTEGIISLSTLDFKWEDYQLQNVHFAGLDSNSNPVFYMGGKAANNDFIAGLFRLNSDGTITESSKYTLKAVGSDTHIRANSVVGRDTSNNLIGVTVGGITPSGQGAKMIAYKQVIDLDNLTLGTLQSSGYFNALTPTAQFAIAAYVGNGRFVAGYRNGGIRGNLLTCSTSGITASNENYIGFGDGVWQEVVGFDYQNDNYYRMIAGNGNDNNFGAGHFYNTTAGTSVTNDAVSVGLAVTRVLKLNNTNVGMILAAKNASAQARGFNITWPTGGSTTNPTITVGGAFTFADNNIWLGAFAAASDPATGKAYVLYNTSSGYKFTTLTASGANLSEGTPVGLGVTPSNWLINNSAATLAGNYFVSVIDDSTSAYPQIYYRDVTA